MTKEDISVEEKENGLLCGCTVIHEDNLKKVSSEINGDDTLCDMSEFFKMFADSTRLKIINALMISEMCVCDLAALIHMNQSAVSHHLKILRSARVIKSRRDGKVVYYSLCDDHINLIFNQGLTHIKESY